MTLGQWLRRLDPRYVERQSRRVEAVAAVTKASREDVRHLQRAVERLSTELHEAQIELARLVALREGEQDAGSRLDALVPMLDVVDLAAHVERVVARARVGTHPTPHMMLEGVLPAEIYRHVVEIVPPRVFGRNDRRGGVSCRVPPTMAPTVVMAAWTLLTELVRDVLAPAVLGRLSDDVDARCREACPSVTGVASAGVAVLAEPGSIVYLSTDGAGTAGPARPWEWVTIEMCLGGEAPAPAGVTGSPTTFRPNSALVALATVDHRQPMRVEREAHATPRYIWETRLGLSVEHRRRLLDRMAEQARARWLRLEEETR